MAHMRREEGVNSHLHKPKYVADGRQNLVGPMQVFMEVLSLWRRRSTR